MIDFNLVSHADGYSVSDTDTDKADLLKDLKNNGETFQKHYHKSEKLLSDSSSGIETLNNEPQISRLSDSFNLWKGNYLQGGIGIDRAHEIAEYSDKFVDIMTKAVNNHGYDNPQGFLNALSKSELKTLQVISGLAEPIKVNELDKEGAINLLLPRNEAKDLNNDGFVMNGKAVTWSFPPPNAPSNVKKVWQESTADMSASEKMLAMTPFMPVLIRMDSNGNPQEIKLSEYINPYAAKDFSYENFVQDRLEALEYFKNQKPIEQYQREKEFLTIFLASLQAQSGVA